jgi:hypothetical protein
VSKHIDLNCANCGIEFRRVAGGTGSGKTYSALRIARGIAGGQPFAGIDTENGRMNHYAETFPELHVAQLKAPFRPQSYAEAIEAAAKFLSDVPVAHRVVVVDSASHEWAGDGGCLDWHDELAGGDPKKNLAAWIKPKGEHKRMVTRLLQLEAHVILCFRAEPKVEAVVEGGQTKYVAKKSITGLDGWIPISEKMLPYELTASFLLMADAPGIPKPIKLEEQHKPFVPLDRPLDETVGKKLAEWARGGAASSASPKDPAAPSAQVGAGAADSPPDSPTEQQTAFTAPEITRLTATEFARLVDAHGIAKEQQRQVGAHLFPGRAPKTLNDEERAKWWAALAPKEVAA